MLEILTIVKGIDSSKDGLGSTKDLPVYAGGHFCSVFRVAVVERGSLSVR